MTNLIQDNPELTEKQILQLKYNIKLKIRALGAIISINKDSDVEEVNLAIRNFWFELRSEWIRHNMINNYNMVMTGTADVVSVIQSAFISGMIGELENFIPENELEKMNEIMVKVQYGGEL
ncbi:MAG TPA: hypothetical protein PK079_09120 [Leptospiraceae bacterium]|nr:hypothetical protein [Leptospiraceae bacterium]HMW06855.1 hypothetical protein [Leptospiraceae bacterium]HMX32243.1 hypothetical protein [Leptospiraceae bacterium]HMY32374.1 hypothetical protein [Leptospiraceae bacterium]HMZ65588.1 hypothetical protein [Leptospiraceae bacterium]